jgi:hypothetical protein
LLPCVKVLVLVALEFGDDGLGSNGRLANDVTMHGRCDCEVEGLAPPFATPVKPITKAPPSKGRSKGQQIIRFSPLRDETNLFVLWA